MSVREPGVHVEFEMYPMVHALESKSAGREVCVEKPHITVSVAGMEKEKFFGPVNDYWKQRFPEEWAAFEKGELVPVTGTPLNRWPQLTVGQVKNLKGLDFHTVEDVASASDASLQKVMNGYKLREDAQKFLSLAQGAADLSQLEELREASRKKDELMAAQNERLAAMEAQMAALLEQKPEEAPKRGRKATA
jgi:hypothetical protein